MYKLFSLSWVCCLLFAMSMGAQAQTKPCRLSSFSQEVRCGVVQRLLDPSKPDGLKIDVHYAVLPSQDKNKLPDAVFLLAGGPGQSAIDVASFGEAILEKLNRRRDLVFVDQRGTGKSAPLSCPELEAGDSIIGQATAIKQTEKCMADLQKLPYGDLRFYSTSIAVQDLEAVRLAQKYASINVVGVSYGTRVGLEYLRQFPLSVRRLIIDGVVPPDMVDIGKDAKKAVEGMFEDCVKNARCDAAYPNLAATWKHLLSNTPRKVSFTHPRIGSEVSVNVTQDDIVSMVFKGLYSPAITGVLPYAITQADQGKFGALVNLSGALNLPSQGGMMMGMHYSVWCSEAYAQPRTSTKKDEFISVSGEMYDRVCANWPHADIPKEFFNIPRSPIPVLLLSGGIDPVTPTQHGTAVAKALGEKARHIYVENAGHGLLTHGCVREVVNQFIATKEDADALKVDATCVRQIPRPLVWIAPKAGEQK